MTIIDVARRAGVSKSTAARALADYGSVSEKTRRAVQVAADELGYQANALARSMITGRTMSVGVVVPDISNPFFANAVRGISTAAREGDYDVLLSSTDGDLGLERRAVSVLAGKKVDGVIIAPVSTEDTEHLESLEAKGIAVTLLDRPAPRVAAASYVAVDHVGASALAVNHLIDLGHRDIGIVTEASPALPEQLDHGLASALRPAQARLVGYATALRSAGIRYDPALVASSAYARASASAAVRGLLESQPQVTAVYCTDSELSAGAFAALQDLRIDCPGQVSLIGFDDQDWATLVRPRLTVVEQPSYQLGRTAMRELIVSMVNPAERRRHRTLLGRLIVRDSTARPRVGALTA
ncbi:LacI family DNA-binding transcriptional regulator [Sinomonas soli]